MIATIQVEVSGTLGIGYSSEDEGEGDVKKECEAKHLEFGGEHCVFVVEL